jgi:hypothetical protein
VEQTIDDSLLVTGAGSAIADLQTIAKRSGDPTLSSAVRRVSWTLAHTASRLATAEAATSSLSERFEVVIRQRDEAVTLMRESGLPARLERQEVEARRAIQSAKDALWECDEWRMAWDALRAENEVLRAQNAALQTIAAPGAVSLPPVNPKVPSLVDEFAVLDERDRLGSEIKALSELGASRTPAQKARMLVVQKRLNEIAPAVKSAKAARHEALLRKKAAAAAGKACF